MDAEYSTEKVNTKALQDNLVAEYDQAFMDKDAARASRVLVRLKGHLRTFCTRFPDFPKKWKEAGGESIEACAFQGTTKPTMRNVEECNTLLVDVMLEYGLYQWLEGPDPHETRKAELKARYEDVVSRIRTAT